MKKTAVAAAVAMVMAGPATAGPDLIKFPSDYLKGTLYATVDRADVKQYRELYTQAAVVEAVRKGKPIPSGAVIVLVQWSVEQDDKGVPKKGADGRFIKKDILAHTVMEKRTGWGTEYPDSLRNGEWEYSVFNAKMEFNPKANFKGCFECHKPHEKIDYVISLASLRPGAASMPPKVDVKINSFVFGPSKLAGTVGQPVTWVNEDASPHQITIVSTKERSPILLKGQSHMTATRPARSSPCAACTRP